MLETVYRDLDFRPRTVIAALQQELRLSTGLVVALQACQAGLPAAFNELPQTSRDVVHPHRTRVNKDKSRILVLVHKILALQASKPSLLILLATPRYRWLATSKDPTAPGRITLVI
jgi:DNA-binding LytR/AlgR family response regulator